MTRSSLGGSPPPQKSVPTSPAASGSQPRMKSRSPARRMSTSPRPVPPEAGKRVSPRSPAGKKTPSPRTRTLAEMDAETREAVAAAEAEEAGEEIRRSNRRRKLNYACLNPDLMAAEKVLRQKEIEAQIAREAAGRGGKKARMEDDETPSRASRSSSRR